MDELSRQIGRTEFEIESKGLGIDNGLKLANLYAQNPDMAVPLADLLSKLLEKEPQSYRLQEFIYQFSRQTGNKEQEKTSLDKLLEIEPTTIEELRSKVFILTELKNPEKAKEEADKFEAKNGISPETCWMKADSLNAMGKKEDIEQLIKECDKMPESYMKSVALAAMLIGVESEKLHENWERAQGMLLDVIKLEPKNLLAYRLFFSATRSLAPNRKTIDTILNIAITDGVAEPFVFLNILNIYIEYSIVIRSHSIFNKLKDILPQSEHPVVKMLEALALYFDNYGLCRSILGSWYSPDFASKADFSIYISNLASDLSNAAEKGLGVKFVSADKKNSGMMTNEELAKYLRNIAVESLQTYISLSPNNPDSHYRLGMLFESLGDERAYASFEKALELSPDNVNVMYRIAVIKDKADDDIEAYEMFRRIANSKTTDMTMMIDAMIRASEIAIKYGWIEEGEEFLERANALMPTNPQVVTMLGKVFLKEAKIIGSDFALMKAQENFMKALALDQTNVDASYYLGQVYYMKREYLAAIRQFTETSNRFKECSMLCSFWTSRSYHQLYKGLLFSSKDFLTSAIKHAESLRTLSEKIPETQEYIAELYFEAGMEDEANKLLNIAKNKMKKEFVPKEGVAGEIKVLAVYAPQVARPDDPNRVERVFSKGSVGMLEVSYIPGNGGLLITGNMGESFQNAIEVAYAFFKRYLMSKNRIQDPAFDIHVDVPGWFPKYDGPSAGVNLAVAMISAYTGKPIPKNVTMTGEISFHGNVMPVGGIKEKIEATYEKGVEKVFIPKENQWDYLDMLIKDTRQEMVSENEKTPFKLPIIIAVKSIEEVVEELGIGADVLVEEADSKQ